jgi:hypothetical protein
VGPLRSGETSRLGLRDPEARGSSAGRMVAKKARGSRDRSWCTVAAHNQSLHAGLVAVHHKIVGLLG